MPRFSSRVRSLEAGMRQSFPPTKSANKEAAPDHFGRPFDLPDLFGGCLALLHPVVPCGVVLGVDILPQPADDAHQAHVDSTRSAGRWLKQRLKAQQRPGKGELHHSWQSPFNRDSAGFGFADSLLAKCIQYASILGKIRM